MKVFERPRAEMVIRLSVVLVLGLGAGGCRGGSDRPADSRTEAATSPETDGDAPLGTVPPQTDANRIVFLGTSLTAGYGLEDPDQAYPALIQTRMDSLGMAYTVVNAGVSGDTSAGGLARLGWILEDPLAVLVIELGANDGLRGQSIEALQANLEEVITLTKATHPTAGIVVAGMEAPPNLGPEYTRAFRETFPSLASAQATDLIPFLLDGVAGERRLNQGDGIHPNIEGHRLAAQNVWAVLEGVLLARCNLDGACPPS